MTDTSAQTAKAHLEIVAILVGVCLSFLILSILNGIAQAVVGNSLSSVLLAILFIPLFFAISVPYVYMAAGIVVLLHDLRAWAHPHTSETLLVWSDSDKMLIGAYWIFLVAPFVIIYVFLGTIHRAFPR